MDEKLIKKEPLGNGCFVYVSPRHTFGTDAVLLADFAAARKDDRLVDLGTGCGIIPFLILRNGALKSAVGVEISSEAAALAKRTESELKTGKFTALNADLKDLKGRIEFGCHTLVTCNPPYMTDQHGLKNPELPKAIARHEILCSFEDVARETAKLLKPGGRFYLVHRPFRLAELIMTLGKYKLEPKRMQLVYPYVDREPNMVLLEACRGGRPRMTVEKPLIVYREPGVYTDEIYDIYGY